METAVSIIVALIAASVALVGIIVQQRNNNRHRFTERKLSLFVDFWIERWPDLWMQLGESAKDILLTMALPTVLMFAVRSRPNLFRARPAGRR